MITSAEITNQGIQMKTNNDLFNVILTNSKYEIDTQPEFDQVAVWFTTFGKKWSICYQNGDMNGAHKGVATFTNDGADCGLRELREILEEKEEFQHLIDKTTYWKYCELDEFIKEFCKFFAEKNNIEFDE